jgi:hypothetical protein
MVMKGMFTRILLMLVCCFAVGCSSERPLSPVSPPKSGTPEPLVIADSDSCEGINNLGEASGAAYNPPDILRESYVEAANRGCVAKLEWDVSGWGAYWMKLGRADLRPYRTLLLDVRADPQPGIPREVKIEFKRKQGAEVSIKYIDGIATSWKTIAVELADFKSPGYGSPISTWSEIEELVVVAEPDKAGRQGTLFLDNVILQP